MEGRGSFHGAPTGRNTLDLRQQAASASPKLDLRPAHKREAAAQPRHHHPVAERARRAHHARPAVYLSPQINLTIRRRRARKAATITVVTAMFLLGAIELNAFWPHPNPTAHLPAPTAAAAPVAQPAAAPPQPSEQALLQQFVDGYVAKQPGPYAVEIKDLSTGAIATSRADDQILSASLYKLFVAQMIYERVAQGRIEMTDPIAGQTVRGCLSDMITWSDNACGEALGTLIGWGSVNGELKAQGYAHTSLAYPQHTSVSDVTQLLEKVNDGTFVDTGSSQQMYALLAKQQVNNRLPADLPGVKIAHKTGDLYSFEHDAGIVDGPDGRYIISVMTGPWPDLSQAAPSIAEFSKETYQFFQSH